MKTIKINNVNVTLDFSNQFVIARVQSNHSDSESVFLETSDIVVTVAQKFGINCLDVELIAINEDNEVVVFTRNINHKNCLLNYFNEAAVSANFLYYDDIEPELIIEKMKEICNQSLTYKCFYEVIIEPSSSSDIFDVVKEMKSLSEIVRMPVCATFNEKKLRITPTTDITRTVNYFWNGKDAENISK